MKISFKHILILCLVGWSMSADKEKPINIKVVPAKMNKLTLDDLDEIKMEVLHDMNTQLKDLEDEMAEKERLKEKTSSTWSLTGAPIYLPRNPAVPATPMPNNNRVFYSSMKNVQFPEHNSGGSKETYAAFKELESELQEADEAIEELKKLKEEKTGNAEEKERESINPTSSDDITQNQNSDSAYGEAEGNNGGVSGNGNDKIYNSPSQKDSETNSSDVDGNASDDNKQIKEYESQIKNLIEMGNYNLNNLSNLNNFSHHKIISDNSTEIDITNSTSATEIKTLEKIAVDSDPPFVEKIINSNLQERNNFTKNIENTKIIPKFAPNINTNFTSTQNLTEEHSSLKERKLEPELAKLTNKQISTQKLPIDKIKSDKTSLHNNDTSIIKSNKISSDANKINFHPATSSNPYSINLPSIEPLHKVDKNSPFKIKKVNSTELNKLDNKIKLRLSNLNFGLTDKRNNLQNLNHPLNSLTKRRNRIRNKNNLRYNSNNSYKRSKSYPNGPITNIQELPSMMFKEKETELSEADNSEELRPISTHNNLFIDVMNQNDNINNIMKIQENILQRNPRFYSLYNRSRRSNYQV